jgi:hypothetical protein
LLGRVDVVQLVLVDVAQLGRVALVLVLVDVAQLGRVDVVQLGRVALVLVLVDVAQLGRVDVVQLGRVDVSESYSPNLATKMSSPPSLTRETPPKSADPEKAPVTSTLFALSTAIP